MPEQLHAELHKGMETAGIPVPENEERWQQALTALKVPPASSQQLTSLALQRGTPQPTVLLIIASQAIL